MNKKTGIVTDKRYFNHVIDRQTPENPNRIRPLYLSLNRQKYQDGFCHFAPREANDAQIQEIHSRFYIEQIRELSLSSNPYAYDKDTYLMEETLYTARLASGGCLELADRIMAGEIDNGFALIRPPGHHAEPGRGMGFCVLNNAAITANYLRKEYGLSRILLLDFDIHHGNGSQEAFYDTEQVLVVSIHQHNLFPFTGTVKEMGTDNGKGYNINIPVFPQFGDSEYTYILGKLLGAMAEQYLPQIILVSAGFDGHTDDSISQTQLSSQWFATITRILKKYARDSCDNRLLFILEGGYNPEALKDSVLACLDSLLEPDCHTVGIPLAKRAQQLLENHILHHYWSL